MSAACRQRVWTVLLFTCAIALGCGESPSGNTPGASDTTTVQRTTPQSPAATGRQSSKPRPEKAPEPKPALERIHLVTPSHKKNKARDPIVVEAALRMLGETLARDHGVEVHYWNTEQAEHLPDDAYPRIELRANHFWGSKHLRLTRRGSLFICEVSQHGDIYVEVGRIDVPQAPETMYLGMFVVAAFSGEPQHVQFSGFTINDRPFVEEGRKDIGKLLEPGVYKSEDNGVWHISNAGAPYGDKNTSSGCYVYQQHRGDFVAHVTIDKFHQHSKKWSTALLAATGGLDRDSLMIATGGMKKWLHMKQRIPPSHYGESSRDNGPHGIKATLRTGPGKGKKNQHGFDQRLVTFRSWAEMSDSATGLNDALLSGLKDVYELGGTPEAGANPVEAAKTPEAVSVALAEARAKSMTMSMTDLAEAGRTIDALLLEHPDDPAVRYTAAGVGARFSAQQLKPVFEVRGRTLSPVFANVLIAQGAREPKTDPERLDLAWAMMAIGYPDRALDVMQTLESEDAHEVELRALRMFITRDHRPIAPDQVDEATLLEQAAWIHAVRDCQERELLKSVGARLFLGEHAVMLHPHTDTVSWWDRGAAAQAPARLAREDLPVLLTEQTIPEPLRQAQAQKLAQAFGVAYTDGDLAGLTERLQTAPLPSGEDEADVVSGLSALYMSMRKSPRIAAQEPLAPAIGAENYARLRRGLMNTTLFRKVTIPGKLYGVYESAAALCRQYAFALDEDPAQQLYFHAMKLQYEDDEVGAWEQVKPMQKFAELCQPAASDRMKRQWRWNVFYSKDNPSPARMTCRGSWDWSKACWGYSMGNNEAAARLAYNVDRHAVFALYKVAEEHGTEIDAGMLIEAFERMPYHRRLGEFAALAYEREEQWEKAVVLYKRQIKDDPESHQSYFRIARCYNEMGRWNEALEAYEQTIARLDGVSKSNLQGDMVYWYVERGELDKALRIGKQASRTYSGSGLSGYAFALGANGQRDDGFKVLEQAVDRYPNMTLTLIDYMQHHGYTVDEQKQAIQRCLDRHPDVDTEMLLGQMIRMGRDELVAWLYEVEIVEAFGDGEDRNIILAALRGRAYDRAVARYRKMSAEYHPNVDVLCWSYVAACFAGDEEALVDIRKRAERFVDHEDYKHIIAHIKGEIDAATMVGRAITQSDYAILPEAQLVAGATMHHAGKAEETLDYFDSASSFINYNSQSAKICDYWERCDHVARRRAYWKKHKAE